MSLHNQHYLAATALGSDQLGILEAFTKASKLCGCNILDSKLMSVGEECALIFHFSGGWNTIAKLEATLPPLCLELGVSLQMKRTAPKQSDPASLPYQIQVTAHDRSGILNDLAYFFLQHRIGIDKMECETYLTKKNSALTNIMLLISVPAKRSIAELRERFITYCDERNLDALIEPHR